MVTRGTPRVSRVIILVMFAGVNAAGSTDAAAARSRAGCAVQRLVHDRSRSRRS